MPVRRSPTRVSARLRRESPPLLGVEENPVAPNLLNNMEENREEVVHNAEQAGENPPLLAQENLPPQNPAIQPPHIPAIQPAHNRPANPMEGYQNLETLVDALNMAPRPPIPCYSGDDHEDPKLFFQRCQEYFNVSRIPASEYTRTAMNGLKGDAEKWWNCYVALDFDWGKFKELLLSCYDSQAIHSRLNAQLFSRRQTDCENVGIFLQQKYLLYQRIRGTDPEGAKVATLLELLRPTLRMAICPANPQTFSALMSKAIEAEYDLAEQQTCQKPRKEESKPERAE